MLNAVMFQEVASNGGTIFFPILAISNICQGIATLSFTLIHKKNQKISQVGYSATTSAFLGVTEPSMYGINLKYLYPFLAAIIGSSLGAFLVVITGTSATTIGNGG
jgi:trehalose PTS system EIIBC or EIIBCA component